MSNVPATTGKKGADPRQGNLVRRLFNGFLYPFHALGYMIEHPRLWTYALIPALISVVLLVTLFVVLVSVNTGLVELIWARPEEWYWQILWWPLYVLVFASTFVVGAVSVPGVVAAPFNDLLSERSERLLMGEVRDDKLTAIGLVKDISKTIFDELIKISVLLGGHLLLLPLLLIPVAGTFAYPVLATSWTMIWLAAEFLEYPMSRNRFRFGDVRRFVSGNLALCFGFGGAIFLILMIPLVNFLFVPVAVVGGTMLYANLVQQGALQPPPDVS